MNRMFAVVSLLALALAVPASAQMPPAVVAVSPVVLREVAAGQTFVGTVKPLRKSLIGSAADGRVEAFYVDEGDFVFKGQPLVKLRTKTLELERDAEERMAQVYLAEYEELKNGSRPQEKAEAKASLAAAEAKYAYWKNKHTRTQRLFTTDRSATQEEMQEAFSMYEQASQEVARARATHDLILEGPRVERIAQAKAKWESQVEVVNRLNDQIMLHTARAPFDGYITSELTEEGYWVMRGGPIVEMVELGFVDVEVQVQEDSIPYLQIGSDARIELGAMPSRPFIGKVALIVPEGNERSRTFPVKIRVENPVLSGVPSTYVNALACVAGPAVFPGAKVGTPLLKANMFARATLAVGKSEQALLVSKDAIVLGGPSPIIYVADTDPMDSTKFVAKLVPVQLGVSEGGLIQVKGPVQPGQKVIVQGNERLRPMQPVAIVREIPPGAEPQRTVLEAVTPRQ